MADPLIIASVGWGIKVAGWIISPIMSRLLNKGFSYLGFRSSDKLKKLESKFLQLKLMLEATEASSCSDRLEPWVKELKSAFYDAQDILDYIDYGHLKSRIHSQINKYGVTCFQHNTKQVVGLLKNLKVSTVSRTKLKANLDKIEKLIDEGHKLLSLLKLTIRSDDMINIGRSATKTTSAAPIVFGRDGDVEMIRRMLRDAPAADEPSSSRKKCYSVIGIYGIPGSGKTTLAQYVCEHEREAGYFDLILWIHVSQNFSVDTVFSEILEIASGGKRDQLSNLDMLQRELEAKLVGKRFFMVLDDVWYDKGVSEQQLDLLLSPLNAGKRGSRVLVTTRTADAARALGAQNVIPIPELDKEQYLSMFMHYALDGAVFGDQALLREHQLIGRKIAEKLRGSPLAARTVAGQLNRRLDINFWTRALNRDLLNDIMGALWWSYQQLDDHVRQCFTYCSMFPRRYALKRDELAQLWAAEGFLETANGTEDMEDIGHDCFDVLLSCSFIQPKGKGDVLFFTIHDLLHDLAERVAGSDCFRIEECTRSQIPQGVRHLYVESYNRNVFTEQILKLETLRTLVISNTAYEMTAQDFERLLLNLKKLRVLHITLSWLQPIPASISQLKHLRYLSVFGSPSYIMNRRHKFVITLPPTFTKLYHLQKFNVPPNCRLHCSSIMETSNLVNLRYILPFDGLNFPPDIGRVTWLRTLHVFTVREQRGYEIRQLEHLNNIRGTLLICGLENVKSMEEARQTKLASKVYLSYLELHWNPSEQTLENQDVQNSRKPIWTRFLKAASSRHVRNKELVEGRTRDPQGDILEALCPPPLITSLTIRNYSGSTYPSWLSGEQGALENLQRLELTGCNRLDDPPKISKSFMHLSVLHLSDCSWHSLPENMESLTSLTELIISNCKRIKSLVRLSPSLKKLKIDQMDGSDAPTGIIEFLVNLRILEISCCNWNSLPKNMERLASLEELTVSACNKIMSIPRLPPSLKKFTLRWCSSSITESCRANGHPNWQNLAHIPVKHIG